MEIMVRTNDGFEISEADLQLTRAWRLGRDATKRFTFRTENCQSGAGWKMLEIARRTAMEILDEES